MNLKKNNIEFATDQNNYRQNVINQAKKKKGEGWQRKIILCAEGWCKTWLHLVSWSNLKCCLPVKRSARSKDTFIKGTHPLLVVTSMVLHGRPLERRRVSLLFTRVYYRTFENIFYLKFIKIIFVISMYKKLKYKKINYYITYQTNFKI